MKASHRNLLSCVSTSAYVVFLGQYALGRRSTPIPVAGSACTTAPVPRIDSLLDLLRGCTGYRTTLARTMGFPWGLDFGNQNCVIAIARKGGIDVIDNEASSRKVSPPATACHPSLPAGASGDCQSGCQPLDCILASPTSYELCSASGC